MICYRMLKHRVQPWSTEVNPTYEVQVEGQTIGGIEYVRGDLATLLSCHWIFIMEFHDTIKKSVAFMSFYVLGLQCIDVPTSVRKVANVIAGSKEIGRWC